MTVGPEDVLSDARLALVLGVDASGVAAEITAKMTAAERAAVASGNRLSAGISAGADKATVAQLRLVTATERHNKILQTANATAGQRASAQASLISAQQRYRTELLRTSAAEQSSIAKAQAADAKRLAIVEKEAASKGRFGSFLKQSIAAGVGFAGATFAVSQIRAAKDAASDLTEAQNKANVVFGDSIGLVNRLGETSATTLGQAKSDALETAGTFGNLLVSLGLNRDTAAEMSVTLTRLASDLASFNNIDPREASERLRSGLLGEQEAMERLGVTISETGLKQKAFALGLTDNTKSVLPPAIKSQAAYALIMEQSTTAQGDFARTIGEAANQERVAAAEAKNLQAQMGQGLIPVQRDLLQAGKELIPVLQGVAHGVSAVLSNDAARRSLELGVVAAGFVKLTSALNNFASRTAQKIQANVLLARSYDAVAGSAGRAAVAEGAAAAGGVAGRGRGGRLGLLGPLAFGAGATGSVGAASGSGALNDAVTIGGAAYAGAGIGSLIAPGIGTAIGAGVGGLLGVGTALLTGDGTKPGGSRSAEQIRAEMSRVTFQLNRLRNSGTDNATRGFNLRDRQGELARELKAAAAAGRETVQVVDPLTGKFRSMTQAQIEAANAAKIHSDELKKEREAFRSLTDSFRVDPFAKLDERKAISPDSALGRIRSQVADVRDTRRDFRSLARRGASREQLEAIRSLEASAPGTLDRIAAKDGRGYTRALDRELRKLGREAKLTARIFDEADTLAAERKGKRDAEAYFGAYASFFTSLPGGVPGISATNTGPAPVSARVAERQADYAARQRRRRS